MLKSEIFQNKIYQNFRYLQRFNLVGFFGFYGGDVTDVQIKGTAKTENLITLRVAPGGISQNLYNER